MKEQIVTEPTKLAHLIEDEILEKGCHPDGYPKEWDVQFHRAEWNVIVAALKAFGVKRSAP